MNKSVWSSVGWALMTIAVCVADARAAEPAAGAPEAELVSALVSLKGHIEGKNVLDAGQIEAHKLTIDKHRQIFGQSEATIKAACDLVAAYDKVEGPLWVVRKGFNRGNPRAPKPPANDIHWTIFNVMQNIMDSVYTPENVARRGELLDGFKFGSSANFPGAVEPPAEANQVYRVKINGSNPKTWGRESEGPARRPTGVYLAPGSIATVLVPESLVGKGYQIRVGAHSWDFSRKPNVVRLDRVSLLYPITSAETKVANPLGGGIYVEVPNLADAGVVEVAVKNAVRSPFFSATAYHRTSLAQWRDQERNHKAPWADFHTDKFMMQVPTSWIAKLDDPATLMENWDKAMDVLNDLMGLAHVKGRETMYLQVDLLMRSAAFAPGYPTTNDRYDPNREYDGYANHYLVRGPQYAPDYVFHEQGHGFNFVKFKGEMESAVNLPHVAVWNQLFGYSLDEAFAASRGMQKNKYRTLDNTAVTWMTSPNFALNKPMKSVEKAYQLGGHAKFVDIARLFGWKPLGDFWRSWNEDFEAGRPWSKHDMDLDKISLRLSEKAGVDLTPLLHFWGTPPVDAPALRAAVAAGKLPPSAKVYDALTHYKTLVPKDKKAFREFALNWWGKQPSDEGYTVERGHAAQWNEYSEQTAAQIEKRVQEILDAYFPGGKPSE